MSSKVRLFRVEIDSGGYDRGGAYWGIGKPLYCAIGDDFEWYARAWDREAARAKLLAEYPAVTFFR